MPHAKVHNPQSSDRKAVSRVHVSHVVISQRNGGVGQKLDCSLMETQLACLANIGQNWLLGAVDKPKRW
jgi:hypothetical protein